MPLRIRERIKKFILDFLPAVVMTLAISFFVGIYAPLELYFTNVDDFRYDFGLLFPELLQMFAVIALAGLLFFGICYVVYIRLYQCALTASVIGYLCTYIQGMFLAGNLPALDGQKIMWNEYRMQDIQSIVLWLAVGLVVVLLIRFLHMKKMYRVFMGCGVFFTGVLLLTVVTVGIQYEGFRDKNEAIMTTGDMYTMSEDQNLILFVVDAADSATFSMMLDVYCEDFADTLEDFTYYPDTVAAYPFTKNAIPYLLTGQWYENQEDFETFTTNAMDTSPLLNSLKERGYRMGIYEEELIYQNDNVYDIENAVPADIRINSTRRFLKEQLTLVWYKYAPFPLKRFAKVDMQRYQALMEPSRTGEIFIPNNARFYEELLQAEVEKTKDKCFRFIHIEGAHVPFRYNREVEVIDEAQGSYERNMECSMTIVGEYLKLLKESGVYDNSAIVIMADHGYGNNREIPIVGRGNPLLAVKGVGEHHAFQVSQAPISYEDLQEAYQRLLDGKTGEEIFDARAGDRRERRFMCYFYEKEERMLEYVQMGHAFDINTMIPTGAVYERMPEHGGPGGPGGPGGREKPDGHGKH